MYNIKPYKYNVLVVSSKYDPEYSGSGLMARKIYKRAKENHPVGFDVLCSAVTENRPRKYRIDNGVVYRIAIKPLKQIGYKKQHNLIRKAQRKIVNTINYISEAIPAFLFLLITHGKYDVFHVFGNVCVTQVAIVFAKLFNKPIIIELQNMVYKLYGPRFPDHAVIICISKQLEKVCLESGYKNVVLRPNPVDERKFYYKPRARNKNILHLAKFIPRKKQLFMIDVLKLLPKEYTLTLTGPMVTKGPLYKRDVDYVNSIYDEVSSSGLQGRVVIYKGFVDNPEYWMGNADVFVLPSVMEGLGVPFLEAIACGVPVVTNKIEGVFNQWIKDGINGFCCDLIPEVWAEKIIRASEINDMEQSSKNVLEKTSLEVIAKQVYNILGTVTNPQMSVSN